MQHTIIEVKKIQAAHEDADKLTKLIKSAKTLDSLLGLEEQLDKSDLPYNQRTRLEKNVFTKKATELFKKTLKLPEGFIINSKHDYLLNTSLENKNLAIEIKVESLFGQWAIEHIKLNTARRLLYKTFKNFSDVVKYIADNKTTEKAVKELHKTDKAKEAKTSAVKQEVEALGLEKAFEKGMKEFLHRESNSGMLGDAAMESPGGKLSVKHAYEILMDGADMGPFGNYVYDEMTKKIGEDKAYSKGYSIFKKMYPGNKSFEAL